jgi:hypothetical protein
MGFRSMTVAFTFSQQPLLDGKQEFFECLKVQRTLQNWLDEGDIDMPAEAKKARETVAAKREAGGRMGLSTLCYDRAK